MKKPKQQLLLVILGIFIAAGSVSAATFTVNSTGDASDAVLNGVCETVAGNGICTLRAAIEEANNTPDADNINFNIAGSGVQTITVSSSLPQIVAPVVIDGFTQPGASANTQPVGSDAVMLIVVSGNNNVNQIFFVSYSNFTTERTYLRGIVINGYTATAINASAYPTTIEGCFIGTDETGATDATNGREGVRANGANFGAGTGIIIGGTTPAARNVISGNAQGNSGFAVLATGYTFVRNNYIGTNAQGTAAIPNYSGVVGAFAGGNSPIIGGTTAAERNVVSGNTNNGIELGDGAIPTGNRVWGNFVGVTADGAGALGNGGNGIVCSFAQIGGNRIGDGTAAGANVIANNGGAGVLIQSQSLNRISVNSIYDNGGLGIDLSDGGGNADGVTANDLQDTDSGANGLQNFPVITSVTPGAATRIQGTLNSTPDRNFRLEFYGSASGDPSNYGEGQTFIGATNVTTDGNGDAAFDQTFAFSTAGGSFITATATDLSIETTSEFSRNSQVFADSDNDGVPDDDDFCEFTPNGAVVNQFGCAANQAVSAPAGLSAWYSAEGDARDVSGNGNDGVLQNGTTFVVGRVGQAFGFDGLNDYVSTNLDVQPSAMPTTTWEAWIYPTKTYSTARQTIFTDDDGGYDRGVIIESYSANFGIFTGTNVWQPTFADQNQWQHIAVVYTPTNIYFYKNGVQFVYGSAPTGQATINPFVIGGNLFNGTASEFFEGSIDEVSVYNRQLNQNEIQAIYEAGSNGKSKQVNFTAQTSVKLAAATLNFSSAQNGTAFEQSLDPTGLPPITNGTPRLFYDVSTTANSANANVCFNVSALVAQFVNLRVYHLEGGNWIDRTDRVNSTAPNLCTTNLSSLSPFAIVQVSPTAANVEISGRIRTADGSGIRNASVTLVLADGSTQTVNTGIFGYYHFTGLTSGQTAVISVRAKRYVFSPDAQIINLADNIADADFTAIQR